ncbi:uncharacterized protein LOC117645946 [Thrips palmi]|uniref:Uncharacterized protein LOC117645946 n=1 Tax=Thrips palmi TaxID=161013 RepID=A0A6P8ZNI4_THRPL|nr:uncharacterized protein LOC117645946 [Thrips palmi]
MVNALDLSDVLPGEISSSERYRAAVALDFLNSLSPEETCGIGAWCHDTDMLVTPKRNPMEHQFLIGTYLKITSRLDDSGILTTSGISHSDDEEPINENAEEVIPSQTFTSVMDLSAESVGEDKRNDHQDACSLSEDDDLMRRAVDVANQIENTLNSETEREKRSFLDLTLRSREVNIPADLNRHQQQALKRAITLFGTPSVENWGIYVNDIIRGFTRDYKHCNPDRVKAMAFGVINEKPKKIFLSIYSPIYTLRELQKAEKEYGYFVKRSSSPETCHFVFGYHQITRTIVDGSGKYKKLS